MNRRDFLKMLGVGVAASAMPLEAFSGFVPEPLIEEAARLTITPIPLLEILCGNRWEPVLVPESLELRNDPVEFTPQGGAYRSFALRSDPEMQMVGFGLDDMVGVKALLTAMDERERVRMALSLIGADDQVFQHVFDGFPCEIYTHYGSDPLRIDLRMVAVHGVLEEEVRRA